MRPRSIIGPLLLILIGGAFLMNNLRPDMRFVDLLVRSWPWVLIAWGGLRLVEILVWYVRSKPVPCAGISGGEWTLIVFFTLIGSGAFFVSQHRWRDGNFMIRGVEVFGESYDYPVAEIKSPAPAKPFRLVVENLRGNARITGSDAQEIRLVGRKTIRAMSQSDADQGDKATPVELIRQGDNFMVRTNQERVSGERRASTDIEISVPRGVSVEARGRYGDFDITDVTGDVDINSDNAGVRLQNVGGSVRVETRKSDIIRAVGVKGAVDLRGRGQDLDLENVEGQVTVTAEYVGDVQLRNLAKPLRWDASNKGGPNQLEVARLPGEIRMDLRSFTATDMVGPVRLSARSLDAQIGDFTQTLEVSLDRGDIELRPLKTPLGKMDVRTRSGNIELAVPAAAKFELKATTSRGEIENEFGPPLKLDVYSGESDRNRDKKRASTLTGSVGDGPAITLTTDRGNVTVRKGTGEQVSLKAVPPKPPAPPEPLKVEKN
jgi:DUF4097 and DUF4098 domain-containing protein YvlB